MIKFIDNPVLCKFITICIFLIFAFSFFFLSSFKTVLNCENGSCQIKSMYLFGERKSKEIILRGNDFYCSEEHKTKSKRNGGIKHIYIWNLKLRGEKLFDFDYKDGCYGELNSIYQNLHQNNSYSNTYEHILVNILCKIVGVVFAILAFLALIGKVTPIVIGVGPEIEQFEPPPFE